MFGVEDVLPGVQALAQFGNEGQVLGLAAARQRLAAGREIGKAESLARRDAEIVQRHGRSIGMTCKIREWAPRLGRKGCGLCRGARCPYGQAGRAARSMLPSNTVVAGPVMRTGSAPPSQAMVRSPPWVCTLTGESSRPRRMPATTAAHAPVPQARVSPAPRS
ncbi:hypothetical protein D9M68_714760 [compost metagenome]